jgi:hypothetical protein
MNPSFRSFCSWMNWIWERESDRRYGKSESMTLTSSLVSMGAPGPAVRTGRPVMGSSTIEVSALGNPFCRQYSFGKITF